MVDLAKGWISFRIIFRKAGTLPSFRGYIFLLALALAVLAGTPSLWAASSAGRIRVAYSAISPTQLPIFVPLEAGFYRKNGLDVEMVLIAGAPAAVAALVAGETPIIQVAGVGAISSNLSGSGAILLAGVINRFPYQLFVTPDIQTVADLRGKKFGVSRVGGGDYSAALIVLKNQGLSADREINFVQIGTVPARLGAMQKGSIQATLLMAPETVVARQAGLRVLLDFTQIDVDYQQTAVASTRDFVQRRPDLVRSFMKAYVAGIHYMLSNPEGTKKIMGKFLQQKDDRALEEAYSQVILKLTRRVPYPTEKGIQLILDQLKAANLKAATAKPSDFIETMFLKELEESGYIEALYSRK
ncbi:MAG: ABC transporter substrate-binding protein [Deltaproteobacteria bacterium]|nr:ABC transporter substrate-binding protein [Deltaproteobacteria bacterium]